jgi:hypothetical protein
MKNLLLLLCFCFTSSLVEASTPIYAYSGAHRFIDPKSQTSKRMVKKILRQSIKAKRDADAFIWVLLGIMFLSGMLGGGLVWLLLKLAFAFSGALVWWLLGGGILAVLVFLIW